MPLSSVLGAQSLVRPGVCTSSTRPASPFEGQVIYETDTDKVLVYNGSAWYAPWNTAWGIVVYTTSQSNTLSSGTASGLTTTFTAVSNRRYKITAHLSMAVQSGRHIFGITTTSLGSQRSNDVSELGFPHVEGILIVTGDGSSQTIQVQISTISGTMNLAADSSTNKHFVLVEDIGPA